MTPVQTSEPPGEVRDTRSVSLPPDGVAGLYKFLGVTPHPILELPSEEAVRAALESEASKAELMEMLQRRQRRIRMSVADPVLWGFEAETWGDADALLNGKWKAENRKQKPHGGGATVEVTDDVEVCTILAIFGGNRAQKTYYAVKRAIQCAEVFPGTRIALCSEKDESSVTNLQTPLVWPFLRPRYGHLNGKRHAVTKINYTQGNGFTDGKIVLPNGSELYFLTYGAEPGDYEGWEFGAPIEVYERVAEALRAAGQFVPPNIGVVADESMPLAWLKMFARRVRFRRAKLLWTFTPVKGITPAVKETVGPSAVTLESRPSELLPRKNFPDLPEGHMPYVRKCAMLETYAIYFFTCYNKWGDYYGNIKKLCEGKDSQYVERVAYGYARDSVARAFPKFGGWNVVKRAQLPAVGTNYFFCDPAGTRNWFMMWVRVAPLPGGAVALYIYRDWPDAQRYGEWAITTEREVNDQQTKGWDGDAGPAQAGMGYGVTKYKQTILAAELISPTSEDPQHVRQSRKQKSDHLAVGPSEEIAERFVDPRAGASEHLAEKGGTCIIDEFAAVQVDGQNRVTGPAMDLIPASGVNMDEGLTAVNELLDWNMDQPLTAVLNQPHLFVCEDCLQVRWALENFTGRGGEKGACKDPADLLRYLALAKLEYVDAGVTRGRDGRGF